MNSQIIKDSRLAEEYLRVEHPSGLTMLLYPMKGFSTVMTPPTHPPGQAITSTKS